MYQYTDDANCISKYTINNNINNNILDDKYLYTAEGNYSHVSNIENFGFDFKQYNDALLNNLKKQASAVPAIINNLPPIILSQIPPDILSQIKKEFPSQTQPMTESPLSTQLPLLTQTMTVQKLFLYKLLLYVGIFLAAIGVFFLGYKLMQ